MNEPRRVAVVMSRMPRLISPDVAWLSGLRACLQHIRQQRNLLLTNPHTAGADLIARGAQRCDIATEATLDESYPEDGRQDERLIERADDLFVLGIRKQGNIHRLLVNRLQTGRGGVFLVDLPDLQPQAVRAELLALGASLWAPAERTCLPLIDPIRVPNQPSSAVLTFESYPHVLGEQFLIHTTRACPGPWPQQTQDDYLDSVLDARPDGHHSAVMTLMRIVQQRLLIASGRTIRGGFPVVSFTAVPLNELPDLRCFRTHRSRWDFEPYGLCLRRSTLERLGARPVIYGTDETWSRMTADDRPYFQLSGGGAESNDNPAIDWSIEREWRYPGNLDLTQFSAHDLFAFVPTFEEARLLQPVCPWLITLWPNSPSA